MAKHPSARQRGNKHSTAREIVLRGEGDALLPVPPLPAREEVISDNPRYSRPAEYHPQTITAWAEMWQFPLVYEAPAVDQHLMQVYIALLDAFFYRAQKGASLTELAKEIRPFAEMWGIGEKARRHLQITIQEAEEAMERGRMANPKRVEAQIPSAGAFTPNWSEDDEDDGSIIDATVVE